MQCPDCTQPSEQSDLNIVSANSIVDSLDEETSIDQSTDSPAETPNTNPTCYSTYCGAPLFPSWCSINDNTSHLPNELLRFIVQFALHDD